MASFPAYATLYAITSQELTIDMQLETKLTVPPQVMSRLVGDETVLLDLASGVYFGLDGVGQRIWESVVEGNSLEQVVDLIVSESGALRQFTNAWAMGSSMLMSALDREKKPGRALLYKLANSAEAAHVRKVLTASGFSVLAFMPIAMSV